MKIINTFLYEKMLLFGEIFSHPCCVVSIYRLLSSVERSGAKGKDKCLLPHLHVSGGDVGAAWASAV